MKVTLEGKPEEIQEILSFMHVKQDDYSAVKGLDTKDQRIISERGELYVSYNSRKNSY